MTSTPSTSLNDRPRPRSIEGRRAGRLGRVVRTAICLSWGLAVHDPIVGTGALAQGGEPSAFPIAPALGQYNPALPASPRWRDATAGESESATPPWVQLDLGDAEEEPFFSEGTAPAEEVDEEPFFSEGTAPAEEVDEEPFFSDEPAPAGVTGETGEYPRKKLSFRHRYRGLGGFNETRGIFFFFTGNNVIREFRLLNSYQQTIRIEDSPTRYKFVKFSIDFTQNYDAESEQFFDTYFIFNEIYLNWRDGEDQFRWGNQIFELGKVDFDSPIDVLHFKNIVGFLTFDSETAKRSVPSIRYDRFGEDQRFTFYLAPIAQRTVGMRFTDFRDDAKARDQGRQPDDNSFLRDHFGVQHQWLGSTYDLRVGFFHWFDSNPRIFWRFDKQPDDPDANSFEDLVNSFEEEERLTNFVTFEFDSSYDTVGLKADLGIFDKKNFYSYVQSPDGSVVFDTVRVPHVGVAASLEKTFPFFFMLFVYSYRVLFDVPPGTHVLFYENEAVPKGRKRDLDKNSVTGVFKWIVVRNHNLTLAVNRTFPFEQSTVFGIWAWQRPQFQSEWSLKLLRFETETLKMTGAPIESSQAYIVYTRQFSGD